MLGTNSTFILNRKAGNRARVSVLLILILLTTLFVCVNYSSACGYQQDAVEGNADTQQKIKFEDLAWPVRIGVKTQVLRANIPTVDMVMLVPDEATFVVALNHWSMAGRWPILIEDDYFSAMFIRSFKPQQVLRMDSVENEILISNSQNFKDKIWHTIGNAWRSDPDDTYLAGDIDSEADTDASIPTIQDKVKARWVDLKWEPPGVVITSINDPAWPGAVALAADRGQPIEFLDKRYARPDATLPPETFDDLANEIEKLVVNIGYEYQNLGDCIDTVTVVLNIASKYRMAANTQSSNSRSNNQPVILATTDGLGRNKNGQRWAIAGMIHGTAKQAVYKAMCAIFLEHNSALMYNSYPDKDSWSAYAMDTATAKLQTGGLTVEHIKQPEAGVNNWLSLAPQGLERNLIMVNTKGQKNFIELDGTERVYAQDMPILNYPAAVYFIHSWSAFAPDDRNTVAGRWLDHGAYAFVGSVHEPYLSGFVPPSVLVDRLLASIPFLVAARKLDNSPPWKINTFGDPLMTIVHPKENKRVNPEPFIKYVGENKIIDLQSELARLTKQAQIDGNWTAVIQTAKLLGRDDLAVRIARVILNNKEAGDINPESAFEVTGPFFRQGQDFSTFILYLNIVKNASFAGNETIKLTDIHMDMLWAAATEIYLKYKNNLSTPDNKVVADLISYIREPAGYVDACHIASLVRKILSPEQANHMLDKYENSATDGYVKKTLKDARSD